jgi:hypothetical protein
VSEKYCPIIKGECGNLARGSKQGNVFCGDDPFELRKCDYEVCPWPSRQVKIEKPIAIESLPGYDIAFAAGRTYQAGKDERAVRKQLGDAPAHVNSDVDHGLKLAIAALDEAGKEE